MTDTAAAAAAAAAHTWSALPSMLPINKEESCVLCS
jgi:hypothetical protein